MTLDALPDIPRWYTGLSEWAAALVYISLMRRRVHGVRFLLIAAAALAALIGMQLLAGMLPISLWVPGMAMATLLMFGFIAMCADVPLAGAGYLTARAFVLAELVASLEWQLWVHWMPEEPTLKHGLGTFLASLALLAVAYGVGFGTTRFAERRNFPPNDDLHVGRASLISTIAITGATFLVSNMSFAVSNTPFSGTGALDIFYIRTLVDLAGFVALFSQQSHRSQVRRAMELAETQLVMQHQHEQYLQSKRNIDELNRMHHDLQYYVSAIRAEESAARRSEYLTELESTIRGYETEIKTGHRFLDIILSSKMERCLQHGTSMTNVVDGAALEFVDLPRLSVLFGNALDNAIEACAQIADQDRRIIKVSAFQQRDFVMIRIENFWDREVDFVHGIPRTTKADRHRHGYGTGNMRRVVESLGGSITFSVEASWFRVRILIPTAPRSSAGDAAPQPVSVVAGMAATDQL
ncbi:ATP-binding protein [Microbacterium sp.]|uniref:ATP-binding protein n=1 Tax=Microbacterium sp. TaxID=51671 RepID=UPI002810BD5A|nr:ATP-binding protein [Microbacterium sp.]